MAADLRKRRYLILLMLVLLAATLIVIITKPDDTLNRERNSILLKRSDLVTKIILFNEIDSTVLEKSGTEWVLPGNEKTNPAAVENILFAATRFSIISIVSAEKIDDAWRKTTIHFYKKKRRVLHFDLYSDGNNFLVKNPDRREYYSIVIAGYNGLNLEKIFTSSVNHYREHILIDLLPSELAYIEINIPGKAHYSFRQDSLENYECHDLAGERIIPRDSLDELSVRLLFSYFTDIRYETKYSEETASSLRGRMMDRLMAELTVISVAGEKHLLEVYPLVDHQGNRPDIFRALVIYNDDPEVLIINYIFLDVLMRNIDHYYRKSGPTVL